MADQRDVHEDTLLAPIAHTGPGFYWAVAGLSVFILWGAVAYAFQFSKGLGVTGLQQPVSWGFYVTNFVFFIGISHDQGNEQEKNCFAATSTRRDGRHHCLPLFGSVLCQTR